jgi:DNA-binding SARP family transcriptional activator
LSAVFVTQREFLPEFDGDWVVRRRAAGRQMHADATACYACACLELGGAELASAERAARRLVELEPLAERGYWLLMRALARRGDQASALLVYERLRVTLREELGVAPSPTISELHATLL